MLQEIKRLTPSISNPSVEDDETEFEARGRSPSPEVELFSPDLEDESAISPPTPGEAFSSRSSLNPDGTPDICQRPNRAPSPALEADERGFTETATAVRARGMSLQGPPPQPSVEIEPPTVIEEETLEQQRTRDQNLAFDLFGHAQLHVPDSKIFTSSPMIHPKQEQHQKMTLALNLDDIEMSDVHFSMMSPEMVDVDELDSMFTGY
jgi:hypothetical protein